MQPSYRFLYSILFFLLNQFFFHRCSKSREFPIPHKSLKIRFIIQLQCVQTSFMKKEEDHPHINIGI